jgi:hypothetical protein
MYFAHSSRKDTSEDLLVVEIDTDLLPDSSLLQADEDAAWFIWSQGSMPPQFCPPSTTIDKYDQAIHFSGILNDLSEYGVDYELSLELLGNCSHLGVIPPTAITKVMRYSAAEGPWWVMFHDPVISPMNFKFHGSEYRATQLVVADRIEEARQIEQLMPGFVDLDAVDHLCQARRTEIEIPFRSQVTIAPLP